MSMAAVSPPTTPQERVRAAAPATLIAAVLMLFFGYMYLARPSGDALFERAAIVLYYTLRVGGIAFLVTAGLMFSGLPIGLLLDAAFAMPCGVILLGCGLLMALDGGDPINTVILVLCGIGFLPAGLRSAKQYAAIRRESRISDNSSPL